MSLTMPMSAGLSPLESTLGAFDAKTHFSKILEWVARGKEFVVTKHGKPVARILGMEGVAMQPSPELLAKRQAAVEWLLANRIKLAPGDTIRQMIDEGKR